MSDRTRYTVVRIAAILIGLAVAIILLRTVLINPYIELVLKYIGINMVLTVSLNLVNGYMGEFSVGHAGFMAVGAYTSAVLTLFFIPPEWEAWCFPLSILAGGAVSAVAGVLLAFPSFRTRGDYLAIVTLAFNMIIKSALENMPAVGGPRGLTGIHKLTTLAWVYVAVVASVWIVRNFVNSNLGRGVTAVRDDESVAGLVGVNSRRAKVAVFALSAFLAGVAGALFAHEIQFINPRSFTLIKSTEMLVMVYLGGVASIGGSLLGATVYTLLLEGLRPTLQILGISQEWRQVVAPLMLILLMIFRPRGIMGMREFAIFKPRDERRGKPAKGAEP